ncbi:Hus1-like protein [Necator americanus]|uniref:Hus1-like protein n=1 Tax=Necator americanus TaxID=51031 RepID=W2TCQ6_NECAM|nr:Hus1-like protein [Necator americanus]ETN78772.1 Hus1-like protein [Necator americanus]
MLGYHTNDVGAAMHRLLISSPTTMEQMMYLLTKLEGSPEQLATTSAVVVDAIATFFRGCSSKEEFQEWRNVLTILFKIALHHSIAVIYVNHVTAREDVTSGEWTTMPFLSSGFTRRPTIQLWLERMRCGSEEKRQITVRKSPFCPSKTANYSITFPLMRFSAILSDQGSVESFSSKFFLFLVPQLFSFYRNFNIIAISTECVGAVAHLCKKRCILRITDDGMCFVANDTLREQGNFLSVSIPSRPDFEIFNFAGVSDEKNEIVMELDIDDFEKSVTGIHSYLKIKLRQKSNQMGIYFPPIKPVMRVLQSLRHVGNRNITLKLSNSGEMHLKCRMEQTEVTVYFTDLANDTVTEEQSQEHWCTVRLSLKVVHMFFSAFMFMANLNVLLSELTSNY